MMDYHAFKVGSAGYLYLPQARQVFRLDPLDVDIINDRAPSSLRRRIDLLNSFSSWSNPYASVTRPGRQKRYGLFLNLSTTCNLRCVYCFAQSGTYGQAERLMPFSIARQAVQRFLELIPKETDAYLIYFGGEPLLAWNTLRKAYVFADQFSESTGRRIGHHLVTNGTILSKDKVDFLVDNGVEIVISIDGCSELQNKQRPFRNGHPSFQSVRKNIEYLFTRVAQPVARATYYDLDYPLYQVYRDLFGIGFKVVDAPPDFLGLDESATDRLCSRIEELRKDVIDFLMENGHMGHALFLDKIRRIFSGISIPFDGCGAGERIASVAPDGTFYACHRFTGSQAYSLGDMKRGHLDLHSLLSADSVRPCSTCWNRFACSSSCFFNNLSINGNLTTPVAAWCKYSRKMTEVTLSMVEDIPKPVLLQLIRSEATDGSPLETLGQTKETRKITSRESNQSLKRTRKTPGAA